MSNAYYAPTGKPIVLDDLSSSDLREEFVRIEEGFDMMPKANGNPNALVVINSSGNGITEIPGSNGLALTGGSNADSQHTHSTANLDDTSATGSQLNTLTDGSDASSLHNHTVDSLNDTTATGQQLDTLTNGSNADSQHTHSTANLDDTSATGQQLDTLTNGSDASSLHTHTTDPVSVSTILYLSTSGNDATGDGSIGNPWKTINKANDYLKNRIITADVTIQIAKGYYDDGPQTFSHPNADKIFIVGAGAGHEVDSITEIHASGDVSVLTIHDCNGIKIKSVKVTGGGTSAGIGIKIKNSTVYMVYNLRVTDVFTGCILEESKLISTAYNTLSIENTQYAFMCKNSYAKLYDYNCVGGAAQLDGLFAHYNSNIIISRSTKITGCNAYAFGARYLSRILCLGNMVLSDNENDSFPTRTISSGGMAPNFGAHGSFIMSEY